MLVPLATFRVPSGESCLVKGGGGEVLKSKSFTTCAFQYPVRQQCKKTASLVITVREMDSQMLLKRWKLNPSSAVEWRAVSEGKPGGVMV